MTDQAPTGDAVRQEERQLWEALGQWSVSIARGDADLAPPQYLIDAVAALAQQSPAVPIGDAPTCSVCGAHYVYEPCPLVLPREPTPEMVAAGTVAHRDSPVFEAQRIVDIWQAMYDAALQAKGGEK